MAKTTAWTYVTCSSVFTYTSGTILQICTFGDITPPVGYSISDVLQCKLFRDNNNDSTEFVGADSYTGDAQAVSFDVHIEVDACGSRSQYIK